MTSDAYPLVDVTQAYAAGLALGVALMHGLPVEPVVDSAGNATSAMTLEVPGPDGHPWTVFLIVEASPR